MNTVLTKPSAGERVLARRRPFAMDAVSVASPQLAVLEDLHGWLSAGHRAVLLTLFSAGPSSLRDAGALCAIREDGRLSGSVSGGLIEDELIDLVRSGVYWDRPARLLSCPASDEEPARRHLPPDARITLTLEPAPQLADVLVAVEALRARRVISRELDFETGSVRHRILSATVPGSVSGGTRAICTILRPAWRVCPVGRPPVVQAVQQIARRVNFEVVDAQNVLPGLAGEIDGRTDRGSQFSPSLRRTAELAELDPLTIVLLLDDLPQPVDAALTDAIARANGLACRRVRRGERPDVAASEFSPAGRAPEEIALCAAAALVEMRAARLADPANASVSTIARRAEPQIHEPAA